MYILGISAYYHDSAACLLKNGVILAAAQEERFTRIKHDHAFPDNAINFCLSKENIHPENLDFIVFYDKPILKFERILYTYLQFAPSGIRSFIKAIPLWLKKKIWIKEYIRDSLKYSGEIFFCEHHQSHAASAFFPSPFQEAAFLTMDGVGEWATTSFGYGHDNQIEILGDLYFPHSLGLLYSAFTYFTGFKVNSGEYKLMGLAPYGEPKYVDTIFSELIDLKEDGSFKLNMKYFDYCAGLTMTNRRFEKIFDGPPRKPETKITQREMNLANSIQKATEEVVLKMAVHVRKETGMKNLCLAGGVALNCVANGELLKKQLFDNIWIQPAAGDAGGALGAAMYIWYQYLKHRRTSDEKNDKMQVAYLGPRYSDDEIKNFLEKNNIVYKKYSDDRLFDIIAELIANEKVIGWFQGRMEFGPRALGSRSIIGDARSAMIQKKLNLIKFRESFRPFAASILLAYTSEYFDNNSESPYMLLVYNLKKKHRLLISGNKQYTGFNKLNVVRSDLPAITHVDYSSRIQTVNEETNLRFYKLIEKFNNKYNCPVILNTSFNVRGEPIVCSPVDAFTCFANTNMDYLVLENYFIDKKQQNYLPKSIKYKRKFELD